MDRLRKSIPGEMKAESPGRERDSSPRRSRKRLAAGEMSETGVTARYHLPSHSGRVHGLELPANGTKQ